MTPKQRFGIGAFLASRMLRWCAACAVAVGFAVAPGSLAAQTQGAVKVELNKLEQLEKACRAYLVMKNDTGEAYSSFKLDLIVFGKDDIIAKRLALEVAPLQTGKTLVKLFDFAELSCADIGRFLLNNVLACETDAGTKDDCTGLVQPSSRNNVEFIK